MTVEASFCCELALEGGHIRGVTPDATGQLAVLVCMGQRDDGWIRRQKACDWRVITAGWGDCSTTEIKAQSSNFSFAQPVPGGYLLATSRASLGEKNGYRFSPEGQLLWTFPLGDAIEHIQVAESGDVWVGYFDEALASPDSLSRNGLSCLSPAGELLHRYRYESAGLDSIVDCYALNVIGGDAWCCYYSAFPLVQIRDGYVINHWNCPIRGAHAFALWRDYVLIPGGYEAKDWRLLKLGRGHEMTEVDRVEISARGTNIPAWQGFARDRFVWLVVGSAVFRYDMSELVK